MDRTVRSDERDVVAGGELLRERPVGFDHDHVDQIESLEARAGAFEAAAERRLRGVGRGSQGLVHEPLPLRAVRDVRRAGEVRLPPENDEDRSSLIRPLPRKDPVEEGRVRREKRAGEQYQNEDGKQALETGHGTRKTHPTGKLCPSRNRLANFRSCRALEDGADEVYDLSWIANFLPRSVTPVTGGSRKRALHCVDSHCRHRRISR